jgi:outer membrane protein
LQAQFAPRQSQLQALNDEVETLRKQMESTNDKVSESERTTRAQALDKKEKQLQRQIEDFKTDSQTESQQVFQRVAQKVFAFLQTYALQRGYSAVIERGSDASPVVWYAASDMDITGQLIKAYDTQSGVTSQQTPASPAERGVVKPSGPLPDSPSHHPQIRTGQLNLNCCRQPTANKKSRSPFQGCGSFRLTCNRVTFP